MSENRVRIHSNCFCYKLVTNICIEFSICQLWRGKGLLVFFFRFHHLQIEEDGRRKLSIKIFVFSIYLLYITFFAKIEKQKLQGSPLKNNNRKEKSS